MKNLEVFNEIRSNLSQLAERKKGLKIDGAEDTEGYNKVKGAKNELRTAEIDLEKLAKSERQQALEYQRGIIKLEKDLKETTSPIIEDYKEQIKEIDELKAREERKALIPDRRKQLERIEEEMTDEDIIKLDEKQWAEILSLKNDLFLEKKDKEKKDKEAKDKEIERIKEAKKQAVIDERERKQKEDDDKARKALQEENNKKAKEEAQLKDEEIGNWLKENGVDRNDKKSYQLELYDNKVTLYKRVSVLDLNN